MKQYLFAANDPTGGSSPSTSSTNYCSIVGSSDGNNAYVTTERNISLLLPCSGTLSNFTITQVNAPGTGKSYAYTVRQNEADTILTATIADTNTSASDTTHSVSVSAGDRINIKIIPSGTPASTGAIRFSCLFTPTTDSQYMLGAMATNIQYQPTAGSTNFFFPSNSPSNVGNTASLSEIVSPHATTIQAFYVDLQTAPGVAKTSVFKIYINGTPDVTSLVTITGASQKTGNVTGLSIAVNQGDTIAFGEVDTGGAASSNVCMSAQFSPTTNGESIMPINARGSTFFNDRTNWGALNAGNTQLNITTESVTVQNICGVDGITLKKLTVKVDTAPGASKSWTMTSRKNAGAGNQSVALSGASATTGNDNSNTDSFVTGDTFDIQFQPSSTPALPGTTRVSIVQFITPAAASTATYGTPRLLMGVGT